MNRSSWAVLHRDSSRGGKQTAQSGLSLGAMSYLGQTFARSRRLQASRKERVHGKQRLPGKYWETRAGFGGQGYPEEGRAE